MCMNIYALQINDKMKEGGREMGLGNCREGGAYSYMWWVPENLQ